MKLHGGCHSGMPAAPEESRGVGCRRDCLHRAAVERYRELLATAREARKLRREEATHGFPSEGADFDAVDRLPTFRDFLVAEAGRDRVAA